MNYGIQLYSIRDVLRADYRNALEIVAGMGYKMVETIKTDDAAADVAAWCKELGLTVSGTHTGAPALADDVLAQTIADHKTMGCKLLIIPGHDTSTAEKIDEFVALINKVQPILEAEGITLAFHNHYKEFWPNEDGQICYEELLSRTNIKLELDTYWAYRAGEDPIAWMDRLGDRLVAIHIKDGDAEGKGYPLGMGTAPVKAVWEKAKAMNIPMIVESETQTPDGPTEAKICIDYLKALGE
jgi:sugar phosphate isomerase/epimerase